MISFMFVSIYRRLKSERLNQKTFFLDFKICGYIGYSKWIKISYYIPQTRVTRYYNDSKKKTNDNDIHFEDIIEKFSERRSRKRKSSNFWITAYYSKLYCYQPVDHDKSGLMRNAKKLKDSQQFAHLSISLDSRPPEIALCKSV